jgi:hypothetical protein
MVQYITLFHYSMRSSSGIAWTPHTPSGENIQQGAVVGAALEQAVVQQHDERLRGTEAIKEQKGCRKQGDGP